MDSTQVQPLQLGTRLEGFEVSRVTDHDPGGYTYVGHDVSTKKPVVICEYPPSVAQDLAALAKARHPNLAVVLRTFEANNRAYLITEPIAGEALSDLLHRENSAFDEARLKSILLPLADGLEAAHVAGVLHLDIQPDHIVVRPNGTPVLVGFGAGESPTRNPGYSAIEQYSPEFRVGRWTDIYALGAVAYRLISGQAPPPADQRHANEEMKSPRDLGATRYHRSLLSAIEWALKVHPLERPQNLAQWKDALLGLSEVAGAGAAAGATMPITATMIRKFSELRQKKKEPDKKPPAAPAPPKKPTTAPGSASAPENSPGEPEKQRLEKVQAERDKAEREKAERERAEREKAEREKAERERAEQERAQRELAERHERERLDKQRREREQAERERVERDRAERERAEREKQERAAEERARREREKQERERQELERAQAEKDRAEQERLERERRQREEEDRERLERRRAAKERAEREQAELTRMQVEKTARERAEQERAEAERAERLRASRARPEPQTGVPIVTVPPRNPPGSRRQAPPAPGGPSWLSAIGAVVVLILTIGYWWYNDARRSQPQRASDTPLERVAPSNPPPPASAQGTPKAQAPVAPKPSQQPALADRSSAPVERTVPAPRDAAPEIPAESPPAEPAAEAEARSVAPAEPVPAESKAPARAAKAPEAPGGPSSQKQLASQLRRELAGNWSQESSYSVVVPGDGCYAKIARSWNIRFGGTADEGRSLTGTFQTKVRAQSAERRECRQFDDQITVEGALTARPVSDNTLQVEAVPSRCSGDCDQIADVFNYRKLERRYRFNISADGHLSFSEDEVDFELKGPRR